MPQKNEKITGEVAKNTVKTLCAKGDKDNNKNNREKTNKNNRTTSYKSRRDSFQEIAKGRIDGLFLQAENVYDERNDLANRYVFLARKLSLKFKVPFSKEQKIRYCKSCNKFLVHGKNARLRLSKGNIVIKCLACNSIRRLKYK